jgi:pilus assembly protein CpaD
MSQRTMIPRLLRLSPLVIAVALAACEPSGKQMGTATGPMPQTPPPIVVRDQHRHLAMDLMASGAIGPAEWARIGTFLRRAADGRPDIVRLTIAGNPPAAAAAAVERQAVALGYSEDRIEVAPPRTPMPGMRRTLELIAQIYVPVLPDCPNTTHLNIIDGDNQVSSNWGCATVSDLELQVADPRDLVRGETGGEAGGAIAAAAIARLQADKVKKYISPPSVTTGTGGGS